LPFGASVGAAAGVAEVEAVALPPGGWVTVVEDGLLSHAASNITMIAGAAILMRVVLLTGLVDRRDSIRVPSAQQV
jgi:hypothetical protein